MKVRIVLVVFSIPCMLGMSLVFAGRSPVYAQTTGSRHSLGTFTRQSFQHFLGATGWCDEEDCDDAFQDAGSANCSVFQVVETQQSMKDSKGTVIATGYAFNSEDSTNGTPCYAAWGAFNFVNGYNLCNLGGCTMHIGTLNTQVYSGFEFSFGSSPWYTSKMLSGADLSGNTCISTWMTGQDDYSGYSATFSWKLIGGGQNC